MNDLFTCAGASGAPLADRMRPRTLDEFIGQEHIVGEGRLLRRAIRLDRLQSSVFFGPPGTGKTTLASIVASTTGGAFEQLNAVTSGVKDLRDVLARAEDRLKLYRQPTYLLLDECHRWSRTQSDALLPALEKGIVRFVGSTTENPMTSMTGAIVSRCRLFQFYPLSREDILKALRAAIADPERGLGKMRLSFGDGSLELLASLANGDCRSALNALELAALTTPPDPDGVVWIDRGIVSESCQKKVIHCDDQLFYDMLSAFCKSLRGSDADAALAWFARLLYAGCDPRVIARRLVAHASEDVGLANPQAMVQAVAAFDSVEKVGLPEARLSLAQAIIFICESPKSDAVAAAVEAASSDAETAPDEPVPLHLRDTAYSGADRLGHGTGYKYPHDHPGHWIEQEYMPASCRGRVYYRPTEMGMEVKIREARERREGPRKHTEE